MKTALHSVSYAGVWPGQAVLTPEQADVVRCWFPEPRPSYAELLHRASRDGWAGDDLRRHQLSPCTLYVFRSAAGEVFGAYRSVIKLIPPKQLLCDPVVSKQRGCARGTSLPRKSARSSSPSSVKVAVSCGRRARRAANHYRDAGG